MRYWIPFNLLLLSSLLPGAESQQDAEKTAPLREEPEAVPRFKNAEAAVKFRDSRDLMERREYAEARRVITSLLPECENREGREILASYNVDTRLGEEIEEARELSQRKGGERKAIALIQKSIKKYPGSRLVPEAEKLVREIEEIIYLVLDDFEPAVEVPNSRGSLGRRRAGSINTDPRFVMHGKGSLKWEVGYRVQAGDYESRGLTNPITKWRYLIFWLCLPDRGDGILRVLLSPDRNMTSAGSLYSKQLVQLRGKLGWFPVKLDLHRDFGNTKNIKLEDVRYIGIHSAGGGARTVYLDFVHLE